MGLPVAHLHRESFWAGTLPLWNPYSNCGAPFLAQWGTMILYPLSLIYVLLPLPWSLNVFCVGHLLLGGMGMFYLVRAWTGRPLAAAIASIAFVFNGVTLSCLVWANYLVALGWMPWLLLSTRMAWVRGGRSVLYSMAVAALQLLSGAPEIVVLSWAAIGVVYLSDLTARQIRLRDSWLRVLGVILGAALLCAPQLIPFGELLAQSHRMGAFRPKEWAIPQTGWANLFLPVFRYSPPNEEIPQMQSGQLFLISYYLGLAPLLLAALAPAYQRKRHSAIGLLILSGLCLVLAMGDNLALHPLLGKWIPALYLTQFPVKFTLLFALAFPLLTGLGAAYLLESFNLRTITTLSILMLALLWAVTFWGSHSPDGVPQFTWVFPNAWTRTFCFVVAIGCLCWLAWPASRSPAVVPSLVLALTIMVDGTSHNRTLIPRMSAGAFSPGLWSLQNTNIAIRLGEARAFVSPAAEAAIGSRRIQGAENRVVGRHLALWSHFNLLEGIPKVNGSSALPMKGQKEIERQIYRFQNPESGGMLNFLGVSWINGGDDPTSWRARPGGRAWLQVGAQPQFDEATNLLSRVFSNSFQPERQVWLPKGWESQFAGRTGAGRIVQQHVESQRILATVDLGADGILTVAQSYSPHWKAWVNGVSVPLAPANGGFQALPVPRGLNRVELRYVDSGFWLGIGIFFLAAAGWVSCWLRWPPASAETPSPAAFVQDLVETSELPKAA